MHSFSLTENNVVVYDLPVTLDPKAISSDADATSPSGFPYRWNPDYRARVGVLPRDCDAVDLRWFEIKPCYLFHTMNAYDHDGRIVVDVVRHPTMFVSEIPGPNEEGPTLDRWTIDLSAGKVFEERLDDRAQEFPRIDERLTGLRHRYGYSVAGTLQVGDSIVYKYDFDLRRQASRSFGPKGLSELVFVPSGPDAGFVSARAAAEDYGVIVDEATSLIDEEVTARRRAEPRGPLRMFHRHGYFGPILGS